jgi:hypothetical protein
MKVAAAAHPEKRLFISLLTRDISLTDAFLDLLDNSINAAVKSVGLQDGSAADYINLLETDTKPVHTIKVKFDANKVEISDNCGGISSADAREKVFVFGAADESHMDDKLSVYGIGLKRAMFKLGNKIDMVSDHADGGFELDLDVDSWRKKQQTSWSFDIVERQPSATGSTNLCVTQLYDSVRARLANPSFETELKTRISRAYSFFISRIIKIELNGANIEAEEAKISSNKATSSFEQDGVSVALAAGLGITDASNRYSAEFSGWNVYCNGRAIIFYDRSPLTGWGVDGLLPSYQPKHRPFVGSVFFTSTDPEKLPWTTTKLGVNTDNLIWQSAVQRMADLARQVIKFLDGRYSEEGTSISMSELADAIGGSDFVRPALSTAPLTFSPPRLRKADPLTSIQFKVDKKLLAKVKAAIGNSSMSNVEVGQYVFDFFVTSEVE